MPEVNIDRKLYIAVSDDSLPLYPATNLYPSPELYPQHATVIDTIVAGTATLEKILLDDDFKFGNMCSDKFEVDVYAVDDLSGKYIFAYQIDGTNYNSLFSGIIESCKLDRIGADRHIIAYDLAFWKRSAEVAPWWTQFWNNQKSGNTYTPATLKQLRESLCEYMLLTYEQVTLPNDSITVTKDIDFSSISFGDMLFTICELNCCFPHFNEQAELEFVVINVESTAKSIETNIEGDHCTFEEYVTNPFGSIAFCDSSESTKQLVGRGELSYVINNNFLLYTASPTTLNSIGNTMLDYLESFCYTPAEVALIVSDLSIKLGDYLATSRGNFYAFQISYKGSMLVDETIKAVGKQDMGEATTDSALDFIILSEKYHRFKVDTELWESEVGEQINGNNGIETRLSRVTQTANNISAEVEEARGDQSSLKSSLEILPHTISLKVSGKAGRSSSEGGAGITITLKDKNGNTVSSGNGTIYINGDVIFTSNLTDGTTTISGDNLKTGTISAASISLYSGNTLASSTYYTEINASTGKLRWKSQYSSMTSNGTLTIDNGTINKNVTIHGSLDVSNSDTGYYTRANANTGNLTWNMQNSTLSSAGVLTVKNSTYSQVELGSGRIRFILTDKGSSYINAMYATGDNTVHLSIDAPNQVILSSSLMPSPIYVEDSEAGESYSGYPKLQVIGRSYFSNAIYLNHGTMGTIKIMPYRENFSGTDYKAIWVPNLVTGNAIWSNGPIYQKSQHDGYGYMYATVTGEDIRTGSYSFNVPHNTWKSIGINFNIAMAGTPTVVATLCTSSQIDPDGISIEVYGVSASGFSICIANNSTAYGDIKGLTVNYFAIVKRV